jgi:hypothetical protein
MGWCYCAVEDAPVEEAISAGTVAGRLRDDLPLATDLLQVEVLHMTTPSPLDPLGRKGAGEGGTVPAIAALLSAVENAR